jgi:hypothetical protein
MCPQTILNNLDELEDYLLRLDCSFWACDGEDAPAVYMKTCIRCYGIKKIRAMKKQIIREMKGGKS